MKLATVDLWRTAQVTRRFIQRRTLGIIAPALWILLGSLPALAWGCRGHQVVAIIAQDHLNPHARAEVGKLIAGFRIDPALRRFCDSRGLPKIADLATWADDVRSERKETAPWHFIDIPRSFADAPTTDGGAPATTVGEAPAKVTERFCGPGGCVTRALREQTTLVRDAHADPQARAEALLFVIHFVGDLHQPLHTTSNNDEGGNCLPVAYFDLDPTLGNPDTGSYRPNLHGVWDSNLIDRSAGSTPTDLFAQTVNRRYASKAKLWQQDPVDVDAWALEGHRLADEVTYGRLPKAVPVEPPREVRTCNDDERVSQRLLALDEHLGEAYQSAVAPVVEEQLAKAGVRLAMALNQVWP